MKNEEKNTRKEIKNKREKRRNVKKKKKVISGLVEKKNQKVQKSFHPVGGRL